MNSIAVINGSYDYQLVGLSITLAMVASYAALDLAGRVTSTRGRGGLYGLVLGAMGLGIWAMRYVGMLKNSLARQLSRDKLDCPLPT